MNAKDHSFFSFAKHASEMSDNKCTPMGCAAVYKGSVLSMGWNQTKTSPLQQKYNKYRKFNTPKNTYIPDMLHAEVACLSPIIDLDINWDKVELYVYRKRKDREHGLARPCPACYRLIKDLGISTIHYTTDDGYAYEEIDSICNNETK